MHKTRKGFTLIELLIVIAIIGTLTALMTLSSANATASAEAAKVVSALRVARSAAIMYYWDHPDQQSVKNAQWTADVETKFNGEIGAYLETTPEGTDAGTAYTLKLITDEENDDEKAKLLASNADWYVGYTVANNTKITDAVKDRLVGQASSYGLYGITDAGAVDTYKKTDTVIYVKVRSGS